MKTFRLSMIALVSVILFIGMAGTGWSVERRPGVKSQTTVPQLKKDLITPIKLQITMLNITPHEPIKEGTSLSLDVLVKNMGKETSAPDSRLSVKCYTSDGECNMRRIMSNEVNLGGIAPWNVEHKTLRSLTLRNLMSPKAGTYRIVVSTGGDTKEITQIVYPTGP